MTVHLHKESVKIRIKRVVRQGDTISPKLFTTTLESILRRLNWENKAVKIDGEFLSNLRFADDVYLCTETPRELQQMLHEISDESRRMGLKMNIQFNSIQNSLFSTQHIVHTTMFLAYDLLKRERAEDSAYVGSFPNIII